MFDVLQAQENADQFFPLAAGVAAVETRGGANAARGEKPRLGLTSLTSASHLGFAVCNSTTALGLRTGWVENRGGAYRWARYYNSLTGRFLSRDTESGKPKDPKSLHKYLYANGDPVNRLDPKGRDSIIDYAIELGESEQSIAELRATAAAVRNALMEVCVTEQLGIMLESGLYVGLSWEALVAEATAYCEYLLF